MPFNKKSNKKSYKKERQEADGRISLWTPQEEKSYVISGIIEIGDHKFRVFIYENQKKRNDRSNDYYGSIYHVEEEVEEEEVKTVSKSYTTKKFIQEEPEEEEEEETPRPKNTGKKGFDW